MISVPSVQLFALWLVLAALAGSGCANRSSDCAQNLTCVGAPQGGEGGADGGTSDSGGTGTSGGRSASGGTPPCTPTCGGAKPVCDIQSKTCFECLDDTHCLSPEPGCNTSTHTCVECTKDAHCSGITPICNTSSNTCVQCTKDTHCSGSTPLCDTTKNICVQCKANADCPLASASLCSDGTCSPCAQNADCSHISGKTVCKTSNNSSGDAGTSGTCVQCTGKSYSACGQSNGKNLVCDTLGNTCSTFTEQSAGLCKTCVSDAQCAAGEMCVNEMFGGKSVGYFCFYKQGDTANGAPADCTLTGRPYSGILRAATSIDGQTADICSLVTSTCTALNQFRSTNCASSTSTANDQLCGFAPGVDSKCVAYGASQFLCTVTCLSDLDCKMGVTCNTGVNPNVCNFQ